MSADLDDLPEWARTQIRKAVHADIVTLFNEAIHVLALCQQKLKLRQVTSTRDQRGAVAVAVLGNASGKNDARYAAVDWATHKITINGEIPEPQRNPNGILQTDDPI